MERNVVSVASTTTRTTTTDSASPLQSLQKECVNLKSENELLKHHADQMTANVREAKQLYQNLLIEQERLKAERDRYRQNCKDHENAEQELTLVTTTMKKNGWEWEQKESTLTKCIQDLQQQLRSAEREVDALQSRGNEYAEREKQRRLEYDQWTQERAKEVQAEAARQQQVEEERRRREQDWEKEQQRSQQRERDTAAIIDQLRERARQMQLERDEWEREAEAFEAERAKLRQAERDRLKEKEEDSNKFVKERMGWDSERELLKQQIEELQKQLVQQRADLEAHFNRDRERAKESAQLREKAAADRENRVLEQREADKKRYEIELRGKDDIVNKLKEQLRKTVDDHERSKMAWGDKEREGQRAARDERDRLEFLNSELNRNIETERRRAHDAEEELKRDVELEKQRYNQLQNELDDYRNHAEKREKELKDATAVLDDQLQKEKDQIRNSCRQDVEELQRHADEIKNARMQDKRAAEKHIGEKQRQIEQLTRQLEVASAQNAQADADKERECKKRIGEVQVKMEEQLQTLIESFQREKQKLEQEKDERDDLYKAQIADMQHKARMDKEEVIDSYEREKQILIEEKKRELTDLLQQLRDQHTDILCQIELDKREYETDTKNKMTMLMYSTETRLKELQESGWHQRRKVAYWLKHKNDMIALRHYYSHLVQYTQQYRQQKKEQQRAAQIETANRFRDEKDRRALLIKHFGGWKRFITRRRTQQHGLLLMFDRNVRPTVSKVFTDWQQWALQRKDTKHQMAAALQAKNEQVVASRYFNQWMFYYVVIGENRRRNKMLAIELEQKNVEKSRLRVHYNMWAAFLKQRKEQARITSMEADIKDYYYNWAKFMIEKKGQEVDETLLSLYKEREAEQDLEAEAKVQLEFQRRKLEELERDRERQRQMERRQEEEREALREMERATEKDREQQRLHQLEQEKKYHESTKDARLQTEKKCDELHDLVMKRENAITQLKQEIQHQKLAEQSKMQSVEDACNKQMAEQRNLLKEKEKQISDLLDEKEQQFRNRERNLSDDMIRLKQQNVELMKEINMIKNDNHQLNNLLHRTRDAHAGGMQQYQKDWSMMAVASNGLYKNAESMRMRQSRTPPPSSSTQMQLLGGSGSRPHTPVYNAGSRPHTPTYNTFANTVIPISTTNVSPPLEFSTPLRSNSNGRGPHQQQQGGSGSPIQYLHNVSTILEDQTCRAFCEQLTLQSSQSQSSSDEVSSLTADMPTTPIPLHGGGGYGGTLYSTVNPSQYASPTGGARSVGMVVPYNTYQGHHDHNNTASSNGYHIRPPSSPPQRNNNNSNTLPWTPSPKRTQQQQLQLQRNNVQYSPPRTRIMGSPPGVRGSSPHSPSSHQRERKTAQQHTPNRMSISPPRQQQHQHQQGSSETLVVTNPTTGNSSHPTTPISGLRSSLFGATSNNTTTRKGSSSGIGPTTSTHAHPIGKPSTSLTKTQYGQASIFGNTTSNFASSFGPHPRPQQTTRHHTDPKLVHSTTTSASYSRCVSPTAMGDGSVLRNITNTR